MDEVIKFLDDNCKMKIRHACYTNLYVFMNYKKQKIIQIMTFDKNTAFSSINLQEKSWHRFGTPNYNYPFILHPFKSYNYCLLHNDNFTFKFTDIKGFYLINFSNTKQLAPVLQCLKGIMRE